MPLAAGAGNGESRSLPLNFCIELKRPQRRTPRIIEARIIIVQAKSECKFARAVAMEPA
jgi:hypothetical protein